MNDAVDLNALSLSLIEHRDPARHVLRVFTDLPLIRLRCITCDSTILNLKAVATDAGARAP